MKLGFVSAILDGWSFEEMIDTAARLGYACVEVACWPAGKAERRYAGVSHIDVGRVLEDEEYAHHVLDYDGFTCIEVEDKAFEGSREKVLESLRLSKHYIEQFVI